MRAEPGRQWGSSTWFKPRIMRRNAFPENYIRALHEQRIATSLAKLTINVQERPYD
jgi:hypothetical protein